MELNILEHSLKVVSITKESLPLYVYSLTKILLKLTKCKFFSFTETCDDFTIVTDTEGFRELPEHDSYLTECSGLWVPLEVSVGTQVSSPNNVQGITKIAKSLITPLADWGISVYSLSTYQTDYVLVKEKELNLVLQCLSSSFNILREINGESVPVVPPDPNVLNDNNSNSYAQRLNKSRPVIHQLSQLKNTFFVSSIDPDSIDRISRGLIMNMFYSDSFEREAGCEKFFSFSLINNEVTIVMDEEAASRFPCDSVFLNEEKWKMIKIHDPEQGLGFDECGIVAQISDPLADAKISEYYISTFYSDHTLVLEKDLEEVLELLEKRKTTD